MSFVDTKGRTGPGSLLGPVERMKSAKSRVDSAVILGSRARRPLRTDVDSSIGRLYGCSEALVFSGLDGLGRVGCNSLLGGSSLCEDLPNLPVLLEDLPMDGLLDVFEGVTALKEVPEVAG